MSHQIVLLSKKHKRENFDCGDEALTRYLREQASQDMKRHLALCFVHTLDGAQIIGYYTLSNASISKDQLPPSIQRKLGYKDIPVTLLGRLARDLSTRGTGLGESLLMDALFRSYVAAKETTGSMAVVTDPIDKTAQVFYAKYGFFKLEGSNRMCIMMSTLRQLLSINE